MFTELTIDATDVENARRGPEQLGALLRHIEVYEGKVVVQTGDTAGGAFWSNLFGELPSTQDRARIEEVSDPAEHIKVLQSIMRVIEAALSAFPSEQMSGKVAHSEELSPQEAANILKMSRPTVMRLIKGGILRSRLVGSHHRVGRSDVLKYQNEHGLRRRVALDELAQMTEEYDF